jgi:hypothetical protein
MLSWLRRARVFSLLILLVLFLLHASAHASLKVEWKGDRLSVLAERAPLSQVLQEVARQTGIEFRGLDLLQENVSLNFSHLSLHESLRRLLSPANYVIIEKRSSQGAILPAQAIIIGRLTPFTSETAFGEETAEIVNEQSAEMTSPDPGGVPLKDELTATMISPNQRTESLEDDQAAEMTSPDPGGVPLEDELTATMISPDQGTESLEDEQSAEMTSPDPGGVQPEDGLTTTMISLDQGGSPLEDELTATMVSPAQGGSPLEDERIAGAMN